MPLLNTLASRMLHGRASRQLTRAIPNPVLRYAAVTAITALVPLVIAAVKKRRAAR